MKWKSIIFATLAVVLSVGQRHEMSHDTCRVRSCFTWMGIQVSPYKEESDPMSDWIRNDLGWRPESEDWSPLNAGSFLLGYHVGTPQGNWIYLHNVYSQYGKASDEERAKISQYARKILEAKSWKEKNEVSM